MNVIPTFIPEVLQIKPKVFGEARGFFFGSYTLSVLKHAHGRAVGFAHGFVTRSETAEFLYKPFDYYAPEYERCIAWNDPEIGIAWPAGRVPQLSAKDLAGMGLAQAEVFT